jgi:hypothetical protein
VTRHTHGMSVSSQSDKTLHGRPVGVLTIRQDIHMECQSHHNQTRNTHGRLSQCGGSEGGIECITTH